MSVGLNQLNLIFCQFKKFKIARPAVSASVGCWPLDQIWYYTNH